MACDAFYAQYKLCCKEAADKTISPLNALSGENSLHCSPSQLLALYIPWAVVGFDVLSVLLFVRPKSGLPRCVRGRIRKLRCVNGPCGAYIHHFAPADFLALSDCSLPQCTKYLGGYGQ